MTERIRLSGDGAPRKVRGRPFEPGNPGRPLGSKNKTTRLVEDLLADDAAAITRKLVDKAKAGDARCLQLVIDRISPRRDGRPLDIELPVINQPGDIVAAVAAIAAALGDGRLTANEAASVVGLLESYAKIVTNHNLLARLETPEARMRDSR